MASISKLPLYVAQSLTAATNTSDVKSLSNRQKKFIAWVYASAVNAATTVDVRIEHSPDKVNWKEIVNFTDIAGAAGSEAIYESDAAFTGKGAVFTNVRAKVILSGVTKAATVEVSLYYDDDK